MPRSMTETAAGLDIFNFFNKLASSETKPDVNYFFANGAKIKPQRGPQKLLCCFKQPLSLYLERKSSVACIRYGSLFTLKQTNYLNAGKTTLLMALNKVTLDSKADDVLRYEMDRSEQKIEN